METKHLRTFATIVELESFTRAGRRLGMSQSAISQQVSALERQLNVKLLRRSGGGAKPTPAGEVLLQYARQILRKVDEAQHVLVDFDSAASGVLRVGAPGPALSYLLPPVLKVFRDRFPKIEVHLLNGHSTQSVERLFGGDLDLGLVTLPVRNPKVRIVDLGRDELVAIAPPSHPWADRPRVEAADFANQPLLMWGPRCQSARLIQDILLASGVFPQVAVQLDHVEAVTDLVRCGVGVAVLPQWVARGAIERGEVVARPIGKGGIARRWGVALLEDAHQAHGAKVFMQLCVEQLPPLLAAEWAVTRQTA
jgi:DNA-binding transcriptional LysR family regulator